ncbi:MAG: hypothetical protein Q4D51_14285 [Eubacteriales bacterium]|nr:hypothetical protein [Eubacteriales bacterium]
MSMNVGGVNAQTVNIQQGSDISKNNEDKLSTRAKNYLADLRKQYGDYDNMQALAKSGTKDTTVIFSNADIERMATDKKFAAEKMQSVETSVKMGNRIAEENAQKAAIYEPGATDKKATYSINKMSAKDRSALVQQLKQDELNRRSQLSSLVQQMFSKQAGTTKLVDLFSPENLKNVSAEDIAQAKEDISEDGYWGVKQTSQRIFDFASALAGDDVDKMKEMQAAMEKGFKQATKAWGAELPSISQDTLKAANKLFDDYYASKNNGVVQA